MSVDEYTSRSAQNVPNSWNQRAHSDKTPESECKDAELAVNGFGSISRRQSSSKPMIAAVNGGTYGGGTELVVNCDLVIAAEDAVFATPEVKRGVVALMGGKCLSWALSNLLWFGMLNWGKPSRGSLG